MNKGTANIEPIHSQPRRDMTPEAYSALMENIMSLLIKNGLKATTMDSVASSLKMSKRTLYEIFPNKSEMVAEAVKTIYLQMREKADKIYATSPDVVEALLRCFKLQRDFISRVSVNYFRDADCLFKEAKEKSIATKEEMFDNLRHVLQQGVEEGYFRQDVNFMLHIRMVQIQMESLKRMEELFPPDITLLEIFDTINLNALRSIATPKGLEKIDEVVKKVAKEYREEMNHKKKNNK